jgi:Tfp pilus assembly protein PilN
MNRFPALGLDFVAGRRVCGPIGWLLLLAGALLTALAAFDWQAAREDAARWSANTEHWQHMASRMGGGRTAGEDAAVLRPQMVAAAKAIERLATPWGALYDSLEGSVDDTVSLLEVAPSADKHEIRLAGEARDFAALRAYIKRLGDSGGLADVRLLGQEVKRSDPQHPIVFSIVATWRQPS